jgi:hypothetical protein
MGWLKEGGISGDNNWMDTVTRASTNSSVQDEEL